jgi:hypothetical protein
MKPVLIVAALLPMLGGCDVLKDRMGIPDRTRVEAEGKAIGGACRHAGRGLEDCYSLNPKAGKADIFAGWKEMNEYMLKNNMQAVPPELSAEAKGPRKKDAEPGAGVQPASKPEAKPAATPEKAAASGH